MQICYAATQPEGGLGNAELYKPQELHEGTSDDMPLARELIRVRTIYQDAKMAAHDNAV